MGGRERVGTKMETNDCNPCRVFLFLSEVVGDSETMEDNFKGESEH